MLEKYSIMLFYCFFSKSAFNAKFNAGIMCDTLKETEDSRMKGGKRQRKQKKEEEQRKWEVWKFVEVLKVLKMDYHSVVGRW